MTQKLKQIIQLLISFDELPEEEQDAIANRVSLVVGEVKEEQIAPAPPIKKRIPGLEKGPLPDPEAVINFDQLLSDTAGIWNQGDGLDYQQAIRTEWEARNTQKPDTNL